jgi:hypothetical protein
VAFDTVSTIITTNGLYTLSISVNGGDNNLRKVGDITKIIQPYDGTSGWGYRLGAGVLQPVPVISSPALISDLPSSTIANPIACADCNDYIYNFIFGAQGDWSYLPGSYKGTVVFTVVTAP